MTLIAQPCRSCGEIKCICEVQYTTVVKTYHCDFCDYSTDDNKGCCGILPVMTCTICDTEICGNHTTHYQEDPTSYNDDALTCPECTPKFAPAWEWALANAGCYENLVEVAINRMKEMKENNDQA